MPNPDPEQALADIRRQFTVETWHRCADQEIANAQLVAGSVVRWSCLRSAVRYRAEAEFARTYADRTTGADDANRDGPGRADDADGW